MATWHSGTTGKHPGISRYPAFQGPLFLLPVSCFIWAWISGALGVPFGLNFVWFSGVFCIAISNTDFAMIFHIFWNEFWTHCCWFFDDLSGSRTHPAKPCFLTTVWWICMVLHIRETWFFHDFPTLFLYLFCHAFLMCLCFDLGSRLPPFWHKCSCFFAIDIWMFF